MKEKSEGSIENKLKELNLLLIQKTAEIEQKNRELEIEAALEQVRSRTMAMQHSDELAKTALLMFEQIQTFGVDMWSCGFNIWNKEEKICTSWMSSKGVLLPLMQIPLTENIAFIHFYESRQRGDSLFIDDLSGEVLENHYQYMRTLPGIEKVIEVFAKEGLTLPTRQINHLINFSHGNLLFRTLEPCPQLHDIFKRFAKVFEQTYTRFLDLQKAEAQTKEAQIEAALERVRSRTMAMHHSSELSETAAILFKQLKLLGVELWSCGFAICEKDNVLVEKWMGSPISGQLFDTIIIPYTADSGEQSMYDTWKNGIDLYAYEQGGEELRIIYEHLMTVPSFRDNYGKVIESGISLPLWQKNHVVSYKYGYLLIITTAPFEESQVFIRFAKVFEQTYTRFLDLQRAEEQAKEARIETALERIRARALAMHNSHELFEVANVLREQMGELGQPELETTAVHLYNDNPELFDSWYAFRLGEIGDILTGKATFRKNSNSQLVKEMLCAYEMPEKYYTLEASGAKLKEFFGVLINDVPKIATAINNAKNELPAKAFYQFSDFSGGSLVTASYQPPTEEAKMLQQRAASVFDLAYRRFLDLQKAEEQAREAQIEVALERLRSRSLAMHESNEIKNVIQLVFEQLNQLNIPIHQVGFILNYKESDDWNLWSSDLIQSFPTFIHFKYFDHPLFKRYKYIKEKGLDFDAITLSFEEKNSLVKESYKYIHDVPEEIKKAIYSYPGYAQSGVYLNNIALYAINCEGIPFSDAHNAVFKRFAKVFEQAYTRFLDLQKAEEQAREAQIEAALEKVRSRSLAMHKSDEVQEVVNIVFENLKELNIQTDVTSVIILKDNMYEMDYWVANSDNIFSTMFRINHNNDIRILRDVMISRKSGVDFSKSYSFEEKNELWNYLFEHSDLRKIPEERKKFVLTTKAYITSVAFTKNAAVQLNRYYNKPFTKKENELLKRFAIVFEQAYVRFLDLKKAEAQAREAQIEAALEKVRSRSLAMHKSDEVQEVVNIVFQNLKVLNIQTDVTSVIILKDNMYEMDYWVANSDNIFSTMFRINHNNDIRILRDVMISRKSGVDFSKSYSFDEKNELWKYLFEHSDLKSLPDERKKFVYSTIAYTTSVSFTKNAAVQLNRYYDKPFTENENEILKRFAAVFEQAYVRFLDLKKAEAQAIEAIKQASLDRIRAEIASMRTKDDLNTITPLIWKELTALEVPFIRCGVFIMDESREIIQTYLSKPDGESLSAFEMSFHAGGIATGAVKSWKKNEIFHEHWDKNEFVDFMQNLIKENKVDNPESFQGGAAPPESLYLNFVPFKQGMLYVGNNSSLANEKLDLVKSLAEAFSIAYARYEDFNQLEDAKIQTEKTLNELKSTQSQLIQSEKMASLGELTAGIAHEIQNPLNFVNNFSELSIDLLEEMEEEMGNGNTEEVIEITSDIKQNLDKINQHGKRASSIVKGMLEHSRTSTNQKELTNINTLADEYLRLSYHGLRAKDKTFNADFKLQLDENLPKINVIPQDIGRVLLNLINNAFYACAERSRSTVKAPPPPDKSGQAPEGGIQENRDNYKPLVIVRTASFNPPSGGRGALISVKDNGQGIPESIKEKIFQPFFTTKPTGSGTGLGLSLSYDIIKAHGGEIIVESKENIGTTFIITLPVHS